MCNSIGSDEVWRIGCEERRALAAHQPGHVLPVRGVAAEQPVIAKEPQIAAARHRPLGRLRDLVLVGQAAGRFRREKARDNCRVEAD